MPSRAELLASAAFFQRRFRRENHVYAELAINQNDSHGALLDTQKNTLYCTCSFYPKPCVHAQALALLYGREGDAVFEPADVLPDWAAALLNGQPTRLGATRTTDIQRAADRTRRHADRLERAAHGFEDLEAWLLDTLRRGLATAVSEDPAFYQTIAGRLADASMRGLSRNLRLLEAIPVADVDWADRTLAVLADAALALRAFQARERLPEALLYDLEAFIGIPQKKETVLEQGETLHDTWAVAGVCEETVEAQLQVRRCWLFGARNRRFALLLDYAFGDTEFPPGYKPGTVLEGPLAFYPSAWPQRALVPGALQTLPKLVHKLPGFDHLADLLQAYAAALGAQPWLPQFPAVLNQVIPFHRQNRFGLADPAGQSLPIAAADSAGWSLLALSGGRLLTVFGEWDGEQLRVLSVLAEGRFIMFPME